MAKQMLLFVHGMGENVEGWSRTPGGPIAKLDAMANQYADAGADQFSERLLTREITYDFCFNDLVKQWSASSSGLAKWATTQGLSLPTVVQWLEKPMPASESAAKDFFWSTALDPILYKMSRLVRDRTRETVMSQLVQILQSLNGESVQLTVVAHSLGTMVLHDTLDLLSRGLTPPSVGDTSMFAPDKFTIDTIFMIADVCMLGPPNLRDIDYFKSFCRPVNGLAPGYCQSFYEVWHRYDPFAIAAPFRPTSWGDGYTTIGPLSHFRQYNVHGFTHYLDHPAVHIPIINQALGGRIISAKAEQDALATYADVVSPQCSKQIDQIKTLAKAFEGSNIDLEKISTQFASFLAAAKSLGQLCKLPGGSL